MPLEDFLVQSATITAEAPAGIQPAQDPAGAADRSDPNWLAVADGVPCLVNEKSAGILYNRNDMRADVIIARIYFSVDPVPGGISTRHRITVVQAFTRALVGVYAVTGNAHPIDPLQPVERLYQVDCERIRTP